MKATLTRPIPGDPVARLRPYFTEVVCLDGVTPPPSDTEVLLCTVADNVGRSYLERLFRLKCLVTFSVGLDHIAVDKVREMGIPLVHTPAVLTDATADLAWALILGAARRIKPAMENIARREWTGFNPSGFLGLELRGATLGIIGMGKIGRAVAERARGFGMNVLYVSRTRAGARTPQATMSPSDRNLGRAVSKEDALRFSDVLSIHCPLTEETTHLIGEKELELMKPTAILVNTARGQIVDEKALLAHLKSHPDFYAGLDVFEREPEITEGLAELPNALCLPHIGSATTKARKAMADVCIEEMIRFVKAEKLNYDYFRGDHAR